MREATSGELYLLREKLAEEVDWSEISYRLRDAPSAGLVDLADHGPLWADDRAELQQFRLELSAFVNAVKALPEESRSQIELGALTDGGVTVESLSDESLFLIRERVESADLTRARHAATALAAVKDTSWAGRQALEGFRGRLQVAMAVAADGEPTPDTINAIATMPEERLALTQAALDDVPNWERSVPVVVQAARAPRVKSIVASIQAGDETARREIERFRAETLESFRGLEGHPGFAPDSLAKASRFVETAAAEEIAVLREAVESADPDQQGVGVDMSLSLATLSDLAAFDGCALAVFPGCDVLNDPINSLIVTPINDVIIAPINAVIGEINTVVTEIEDAITALADIFDLDVILGDILAAFLTGLAEAAGLVLTALGTFGDIATQVDGALGDAVMDIREFVDDVKEPFIDMVEAVGDPAGDSELLTQLDEFLFSRDATLPGLVTCMETVLCAETQIIMGEQICARGKTIPLLGAVGSDRSVFACMVIKNEVAFMKDLMPEDTLPGGKVLDIVVKMFVHRLDQLCFVSDWMAGTRQLAQAKLAGLIRDERFDHLLGTCTLVGDDLDCPALPAGQSMASVVSGISADVAALALSVGGVGAGVAAVDAKVMAVDSKVMVVDTAVAAVDAKVVAVDGKVMEVDGKVVTVDGKVMAVDTKVMTVDGKVMDAQNSLVSLAADVGAVDSSVRVVDGKVMGVQASVDALSASSGDQGAELSDQVAAFEALELQIKIEENLTATFLDERSRVSAFQLPAAFGGFLEVVRDVVDMAITQTALAGQNAHQGRLWQRRADLSFGLGFYKDAYRKYARAYVEAVRSGPANP